MVRDTLLKPVEYADTLYNKGHVQYGSLVQHRATQGPGLEKIMNFNKKSKKSDFFDLNQIFFYLNLIFLI